MMRINRDRYGLLAVTLIVGVTSAIVWHGAVGQDDQTRSVTDPNGVEKAKSLSRAFRGAAKQVLPTVVKIKTSVKPVHGAVRENPFKGTPFEDYFRSHPNVPRRQGLGSGVIINADGLILTNNHVVEGASEVLVELADGRQFKAADIKTDVETDLAVLRIPAKGLPFASLGNSDTAEIGDWVIAVGNPFDLELTVSAGIISGKGRPLAAAKRTNFLQTDAAINPGNSGGPLVNLDGEVIGINTAIASSTGGYQGVGFAIPINLAKWVTGQLIESGKVERAYLGVGIAEISNRVAAALGLAPGRGVLVSQVFPNTPATEAGFREGDVILSFAGQDVNGPRQLQAVVERSPLGSKQRVQILRDGKKDTLTVVVRSLPGTFGQTGRSPQGPPEPRTAPTDDFNAELGLAVADLTPKLAEQLGQKGATGVVVTDVRADSVAAEAGIQEGMVILRVGRKPVASVAQFEDAVRNESVKKGILLLIATQNGNRFVVLQKS